MDIANISKLEQTDSAKSRWIFLMGKTKSRDGQPAHTHKPTEQHFIGLPGKSRWSCSFTLQKQLEQKPPRKTTTVHIEFSHLRSENKTSAQTPISFRSCMPLQRVFLCWNFQVFQLFSDQNQTGCRFMCASERCLREHCHEYQFHCIHKKSSLNWSMG